MNFRKWLIEVELPTTISKKQVVGQQSGVLTRTDDPYDEIRKIMDKIDPSRDVRTFGSERFMVMGTPSYMPPEQAHGFPEEEEVLPDRVEEFLRNYTILVPSTNQLAHRVHKTWTAFRRSLYKIIGEGVLHTAPHTKSITPVNINLAEHALKYLRITLPKLATHVKELDSPLIRGLFSDFYRIWNELTRNADDWIKMKKKDLRLDPEHGLGKVADPHGLQQQHPPT